MRTHFMTTMTLTSTPEVKKTPARRSRAVPTISMEQSKVFQGLEHSAFSLDQLAKGYKTAPQPK
jgi:hypothetical protein